MIILVDYDNVPEIERRRGIQNLMNKILNSIGVSPLSPYQRIRVRLYGGWYEKQTLSRQAQLLAAEVQQFFPKTITISDNTGSTSFIAIVELAYSMEIDPQNVLVDTYRNRNMPQGLRCIEPPYYNCNNVSTCPLLNVHEFISSNYCPESGCHVSTEAVIRKSEQKLVDTMLTADLIYLANRGASEICIISSDDDLWPGIKSALLVGGNIFHMHTRSDRPTPKHYTRSVGTNYKEISLR